MTARDLTELAARNLREAILRNSLTTLGIAVGVASLVAMLSLGVGLQELVNRRLARNGLFDSVLVRPSPQLSGRQQAGGLGPAQPTPSTVPLRPLDEESRREMGQLSHVVEVYPDLRFTADVRWGAQGRIAQAASLSPSASGADAFQGMQGHFFSAPDAREVILQLALARDLVADTGTQPNALVGQQITLRYAGRQPLPPDASKSDQNSVSPDEAALGFSIVSSEVSLRVVGIVDAEAVPSAGGGFRPSGVYVPLAVVEKLGVVEGRDMGEVVATSAAGRGGNYSNLTVRVDNPANVPVVEAAIGQMGYATFSLLDVTTRLAQVFAILDLLLGIFGSLALAVASLGIINTLVMAILERRREIGVFKALGASDRDIRQLFFAEAGVMGLVGGVAGVILGWGIGRAIQLATTIYLRRQAIPAENIWAVPWWLAAGGIAFAVVVSLAAGMYPASRAARLDPVEALRYE
jgi:putative ABC transport system permease protein